MSGRVLEGIRILDLTRVVAGPFATAIVFGLVMASALTLYVVPALYMGLEDAGDALSRRLRSGRTGVAAAGTAPTSAPIG